MAIIWSDKERYRLWIKVEVAVLIAKNKLGLIDHVPIDLTERISVEASAVDKLEAEKTRHDVIAFLMLTESHLPQELQPYWHEGLTSSDLIDTANSLRLVASCEQLMTRLEVLMNVILEKANKYKYTPQIGRTHGVHAEPITFGVKLINWYAELARQFVRLKSIKKNLSVGSFSGAVGMYQLDPQIETMACEFLGLKPIVATQVISIDLHAEYMSILAILAGTLAKISTTLRTLQRTEIFEVQEFFAKEQRGSSAMPHKKNPIRNENLTSLARVVASNAQVAFQNQVTWDERDLTNSGNERITWADSLILVDYMMKSLTSIIKEMFVYPDQMLRNINKTQGLIFSQNVMLLFAKKSNLPREEAYAVIKQVAMQCWNDREDFQSALSCNEEILKVLTEQEIASCFDLGAKLSSVDYIFDLVKKSTEAIFKEIEPK